MNNAVFSTPFHSIERVATVKGEVDGHLQLKGVPSKIMYEPNESLTDAMGIFCGNCDIYLSTRHPLLSLYSHEGSCFDTTGTNPSAWASPWNNTEGCIQIVLHWSDDLAPHRASTSTSPKKPKMPDNNMHSGQTPWANVWTPNHHLTTQLVQSSHSSCSYPIYQVSSGHGMLEKGVQAVHPSAISVQPNPGKNSDLDLPTLIKFVYNGMQTQALLPSPHSLTIGPAAYDLYISNLLSPERTDENRIAGLELHRWITPLRVEKRLNSSWGVVYLILPESRRPEIICAFVHQDPWHLPDIHYLESDPIRQLHKGFSWVGLDLSTRDLALLSQRIH